MVQRTPVNVLLDSPTKILLYLLPPPSLPPSLSSLFPTHVYVYVHLHTPLCTSERGLI